MTQLRVLFTTILLVMVGVTVWASLGGNVFQGFGDVWRSPWSRATLFDAYCGFLAIYAWIAWRERSTPARVVWFVLVMSLGNIAVAVYVLREIRRLPPGATVRELLSPSQREV